MTTKLTHYGTGEKCPDCGEVHTACMALGGVPSEGDSYSLVGRLPGTVLCPLCFLALELEAATRTGRRPKVEPTDLN